MPTKEKQLAAWVDRAFQRKLREYPSFMTVHERTFLYRQAMLDAQKKKGR